MGHHRVGIARYTVRAVVTERLRPRRELYLSLAEPIRDRAAGPSLTLRAIRLNFVREIGEDVVLTLRPGSIVAHMPRDAFAEFHHLVRVEAPLFAAFEIKEVGGEPLLHSFRLTTAADPLADSEPEDEG